MNKTRHRTVRHIHARPNEWVRVHRPAEPTARPIRLTPRVHREPPARTTTAGGGSGTDLLAQIALWIAGLWFALWLLNQLLPWLILAGLVWVGLRLFSGR